MKLAVFRAETDGRRTARRLAALGHEAVLAPVIGIVPTGSPMDATGAGAVVFTSQHGAALLEAVDGGRLRALPCFCVGARTAAAATAAGFSDVRDTGSDGVALAAAIQRALPATVRIALLTGRDRKPDVEETLARSGYRVSVTEVYAAEPVAAWTDAMADDLARCAGALHYSRRSAQLAFARLNDAGLASQATFWTHYCLSDDIAAWVRDQRPHGVRVAPTPDEAALLSLL